MVRRATAWGDVNAVLNRLVAEGLIAAFRTNFDAATFDIGLHVLVTPVHAISDQEADALRSQIEDALAFAGALTVTVDRSDHKGG